MARSDQSHSRRRLGPGIYDDDAGAIHISANEVCEHFGVPCNAENFGKLMEGIHQALQELELADVPIEVTDGE